MANIRHDWSKLKAEFLAGEAPTVKGFLEDKGIPHSNIPKTFGWVKEREEMRKNAITMATQKALQMDAESIFDTRQRQARLARFMQLKGAAKLKDAEPANADEARKLVVSGLQEERRALGLEGGGGQNLTQINVYPKTNIDKMLENMDYAGVLGLIAEVKRLRAGRAGKPAVATGATEAEH